MGNTVRVNEKTIVFYREETSIAPLAELNITGQRVNKALTSRHPDAQRYKVIEHCTRLDWLDRHVSDFIRIRTYQRQLNGRFAFLSASSMTT